MLFKQHVIFLTKVSGIMLCKPCGEAVKQQYKTSKRVNCVHGMTWDALTVWWCCKLKFCAANNVFFFRIISNKKVSLQKHTQCISLQFFYLVCFIKPQPTWYWYQIAYLYNHKHNFRLIAPLWQNCETSQKKKKKTFHLYNPNNFQMKHAQNIV